MSRTISRAAALTIAAATVVVLAAGPAFAHEQRQVGAYQFTVGWAHEPTYTGIENAIQLFIKDAKGKPVDDLGDPPSLQVTVTTGAKTSDPLELKASFDSDTGLGTHGEFDAALIPTAPGDYTFHFTGTVNGQKVDEKFTSSDKTFDSVKDPGEVQFPAKDPSPGALATSISRLTPRIDRAAALAASDKNKASSASTSGVIGIVVGAFGVLLAGAALVRGRRN